MILGKRTPLARGGLLLVPMIGAILMAPASGCSSEDEQAEPAFKSFEPAAEDPQFSEPRDAVPLDNGAIAFIARVNGSAALPEDAIDSDPDVKAQATGNDLYGVFIIDAPKAAPRIIQRNLVAPFNIATNGKDKLYVADIGGGPTGQGVIWEMGLTEGPMTPLAEGFQPQGVATDKAGKVFFTGKDKTTGEPGVFTLEGLVVVGGLLQTPSGIDIADDGTIYVADPTAARNLEDEAIDGSGNGVVFKIVNGAASVLNAGFEGGYPTGLALAPDGKVVVSAYKDRGAQSAVYLIDPANPRSPSIVTAKLETTFASAGLHRSRATGTMAWSGGNTVYVIQP